MSDGVTGVNSVSREVVEKIAAAAAREVPGVADLGGDVARFFDRVLDRIGLDEVGDATRGVHASVKGATVEVSVVLVIEAGAVVADVIKAVQAGVSAAVSGFGLTVTGVNVKVDDIAMPGAATPTL
ncbi:Asp23/Gls24 family envelope stress response protein [Actinoplanes sp. CA-054009]